MTRRPPSARTRARTKPVARREVRHRPRRLRRRSWPGTYRIAGLGRVRIASATAVGMMLAWCVPDVVTRSTSVSITARSALRAAIGGGFRFPRPAVTGPRLGFGPSHRRDRQVRHSPAQRWTEALECHRCQKAQAVDLGQRGERDTEAAGVGLDLIAKAVPVGGISTGWGSSSARVSWS